jgi:hypothetical protein
MAKGRIRSIKPEFWSDDKIADLPKATALFFIALWNFADDQGIITDDGRALSLRIPIYRSQDIHKMLNALWKTGLIKRSPSDGLVFINGWAHQKIDRPRDGKWKGKEINWLTWSDSTNDRDPSSINRRKDRIGRDRIGSDRISTASTAQGAIELQPTSPSPTAPKAMVTQKVIARYCDHWRERLQPAHPGQGRGHRLANPEIGSQREV